MTFSWDPTLYLRYGDERGRPFADLLARVGAQAPRRVVDLGCGPGTLTRLLGQRWPDARLTGVDSSPEMIDLARALPGIDWRLADLRSWQAEVEAEERADVLVSNATLQWLPDHLDLLPGLVGAVRPGGWLAFAVPGNFGEPSHTIRTDLAAEPAYAPHTAGVAVPSSHDGATYLAALARLGCAVDVWETTYLHVLTGPDPVFEWISATGARPTLEALPDDLRPRFEAELRRRLRLAYPAVEGSVVLPFRRIFAVAQASGGAA